MTEIKNYKFGGKFNSKPSKPIVGIKKKRI